MTLPCDNGGMEQPRQAIKLGGFYARWPDAGVLVAKEDVASVELDGADEGALPEIGAGETEVGIGGGGVSGGEKAVVLEASGGASGVGEVTVELVGDGDGGRMGRGRRDCECQRFFSLSVARHSSRTQPISFSLSLTK